MKHLHLGSNIFTVSIPPSFRNLLNLLTLDVGNSNLSVRIPEFLGELSNLRILFLSGNGFTGPIPNQLCQLSNVGLTGISSNSLSGSIPHCLQNITGPSHLAFIGTITKFYRNSYYEYGSVLQKGFNMHGIYDIYEIQDEVQFIMKSRPDTYKGGILGYKLGLDLSRNNLAGEIPEQLGWLSQILALNPSHNQLTGSIPMQFSNLIKLESLDLSSNCLNGRIPSELIKLNFLAVFIVANNNLSVRLPDMKAQFGTFNVTSYVGNPFRCGPPLEKKCTAYPLPKTIASSAEEDTEMV